MLTLKEKAGIRDILSDLLDLDLFSLTYTITKQKPGIADREGAINLILQYLDKPLDFLKRQRVQKRVLFSYLLKTQPVSPELTKAELIQKCLEQWNSDENANISDDEAYMGHNPSSPDNILNVMGKQFTEWFFPMYNTLQEFDSSHFWPDTRLRGELKTASDESVVDVCGDSQVVQFLASLIVNDRFFFYVSEGSNRCEQESHGLVRIITSGIVYQENNCIGLFDCAFGLVPNPAANDNWKIKWMHLKIHVTTTANKLLDIPHSANHTLLRVC